MCARAPKDIWIDVSPKNLDRFFAPVSDRGCFAAIFLSLTHPSIVTLYRAKTAHAIPLLMMEQPSNNDMEKVVAALEEKVISEPKESKQTSMQRSDRIDPRKAKKHRKKQIKDQIKAIYEEHSPEKLEELNIIWEKYKGKEEALLEAVRKKYIKTKDHWPSDDYQWKFMLKILAKEDSRDVQKAMWCDEESLKTVMPMLDERAASIGGKCVTTIRNGKRSLIVQRDRKQKLRDKGLVESTVEAMRMELVRKRHSYSARPSDFDNEHERRQAEKDRDQARRSRQTKDQHKRK